MCVIYVLCSVSTPGSPVPDLDNKHYVLIAISGFTILIIIVLGVIWIKK